MNTVNEDSEYIVIYGGAGIEGDHSDTLLLKTDEVIDEKNSEEIDKII